MVIDDQARRSCLTLISQVSGADLLTIEGLAKEGHLHPLQQAFIDHGAFQCGYCTSGMILLTKALLSQHANPDRATIIEWLSSNVCRCTGYSQIIAAVEDAAQRQRQVVP